MRVACPNCSAEYDLPPVVVARLDGARTVRCARCATTWAPPPSSSIAPSPPAASSLPAPEPVRAGPGPVSMPAPPLPASSPVPEVPPRPASASSPTLPAGARPAPPASPRPVARPANDGPRVTLAWTLSLVLLAAAAWAAWHYRAEVMAAWPPAIRAYAVLGLLP